MKHNRAGTPLWRVETGRKLHNTFEVHLNHPVDGDALQDALDQTLRVYPILKSSVIWEDGKVWFVENEHPCTVLQGEEGWIPGCERLNGHPFYITYQGDTIRMALSHLITDGGGMFSFARTLLYYYCCIHDKTTYNSDQIMVDTDHRGDLEADFWTLDYSGVWDVDEVYFEKTGYTLPENVNRDGKDYILSEIVIPSAPFMRFVRKNNTTPSVMAFLLFAQAVYAVRDAANQEPIVGRITVDARKALGIPHTFLNCSLGAQLSVFQRDLEKPGFKAVAEKLRASLKEQTQADYLKSVAKKVVLSGSFPRDVKPTVSISYMGRLSFGECDKRVRDVSLYEGEFHKINICEFHDSFRFWIHMGEGSCVYARAMTDLLAEYGVEAKASENIVLKAEKE